MLTQIPPASHVLVVVLTAWLAGTAVLAVFVRALGPVGAGHFKVVWLVCTGLGMLAGAWYRPALLAAAASLAAFASIYVRADLVVGALAALGSVVLLARVSALGVVLAGALLLGAVTNAMLLGHWHLNQPKLPTDPLRWLVRALWAGLAVFVAVVGLMAYGSSGARLTGGVTAVAFAVFTGVLTGMVTSLVKSRSIMSATGILYLEILLCFVAVFTGVLGALSR
jgi:hypothetical protein